MKIENKPHERFCGAKTRGGGACKRGASPNGRCNLHGGKSTGAPSEKMRGNRNAVSTGEHERITFDLLDSRERELFHQIRTDPLEQINNGIKLLEIRERRMLLYIQQIKNGSEASSKERKFQLVADEKGKTRMKETERVQKDRGKLERILAIEDVLTRVQDKKTKLLELKHRFLVDEVPDEDEEDDGFIEALEDKAGVVWH